MSAYHASTIARGGSKDDVVHQNEIGTKSSVSQSFSGGQTFAGTVINRNIYQGSGVDLKTLQSFAGCPLFNKTVTNINTVRLARSTADAHKQPSKISAPAAPVQIFTDKPSFQAPVVNTDTMDSDIPSSNDRSVVIQSYKGQPVFSSTVTNTNTLNFTGTSYSTSRNVSLVAARPILDNGIRVSAVQVQRDDDGIRVTAQPSGGNDDGIRVAPLQSFDEEPTFHGAVHNTNTINVNNYTGHNTEHRSSALLQTFSV
ncbi:hypothetical protein HYPSUDRAFT_216719 [Hypholoma sublateritium FD-334 SS-4]|uniref:Uncharacterized protein n=1 Tax=Hypholoma sublateritium (strain FD-334 SS-4) TaxID=945553 RepID=A0A0D2NQ11_HYPSF|nr:hypothetical protein HYPSUDRAFT_216719 [Hypholoma sublateritium FD-334 SS-4]